MVTTYHMTASRERRPGNLVLRKILRNADYATAKLETRQGPDRDKHHDRDHEKDQRIIRRMLAVTTSKTKYRTLPVRRKSAELAAWENEGGASGSKGELPIDLTGCRPFAERHD